MTQEQFDNYTWTKNTQVKYKGNWHNIDKIDFDIMTVGINRTIEGEKVWNTIDYFLIEDIRQDDLYFDIKEEINNQIDEIEWEPIWGEKPSKIRRIINFIKKIC